MRMPEPEEILDSSEKTRDPAKFKGSDVFKVLWEKRRIILRYTVVRVIREGSDDVDYYVNEKGLLFGILDKGEKALSPEEVLSKEKSPDGWYIFRFLPK